MGISIDPTPPEKRYGGAVRPAIEAIQKIFSGSYVDAAFKVYDAVKAERSDDEELGQRAWTLWRESLARTLEVFFETACLTRRPADKDEFERLMATVLDDSAKLVREDGVSLTPLHLLKPSDFPLYQALRGQLPNLAALVDPEHGRTAPELRRRLDRAFARGFYEARVHAEDHFKPLVSALVGNDGEAMRRWAEWRRYYDYLRWSVEEEPLFGQGEDGPSLRDIFVPLRCYWRERPPAPTREGEDLYRGTVTAHIQWLGKALEAWLDDDDDLSDLLRIVTGGPGCGKSSSAEILALEVARQDRLDVYLVPLQGLDVTRSISDIVAQHVRRVQPGGKSLSASPIDWLPFADKPLFLIFDGLDEVARPDGAGPDVTRKFVANLRSWLQDSHREAQQVRIKALTLGRPQAAESAADEITLADPALLHVAPLFRLDEARCGRREYADLEISDPDGLAADDRDQRLVFWSNWSKAFGHQEQEPPAALSEASLEDLTIEPLLLYLLIYSGYASDQWREAAENRNRLYQAIFEQVHRREVEKRRTETEGLIKDQGDFFTLMECLGLAAWRGGGRTGDTEQFKRLRDKIYAPEKSEVFQTVTHADLDNVALQFYTHTSRGERAGYAFIHKSFSEYLTARALIQAADKWMQRFEGLPSDFAKAWLQLIGQERLTSDILGFMIQEARLRVKPEEDSAVDLEAARAKVRQLEKIAQTVNQDGFPAHDTLEGMETPASTWRSRELLQRNTEEALYGVLHSWAEAAYPFELLNRGDAPGSWKPGPIKVFKEGQGPVVGALGNRPASAEAMLRRIGSQWAERGIVFDVLARWDLSRQFFLLADFQIWDRYPDEPGRANMGGVDLSEADLREVDLRGANLVGADLNGADLGGADLGGSILICADLSGSNLSGSNLSKADLGGANLEGADLSGTNLNGADLSEADLCGADCSQTYMNTAWLYSADLSNAVDLTQEQIDSAFGNLRTKLPVGMQRPGRWSTVE